MENYEDILQENGGGGEGYDQGGGGYDPRKYEVSGTDEESEEPEHSNSDKNQSPAPQEEKNHPVEHHSPA